MLPLEPMPPKWGDPCRGTGQLYMKQLAETVPLELSITGVETKQQGGETARGSQLQAGVEWQQKRVFSWAGHLKGLSLDLQESPELLYLGC